MTKKELFELIKDYPDNYEIELFVDQLEYEAYKIILSKRNKKIQIWGG